MLFVTLLGLVGHYQLPFRLPTGVIALALSVAIGLLLDDSTITFKQTGIYLPMSVVGELWLGIQLFLARPELLPV